MFTSQIQYHKTLNPKIWLPDNTMDPAVRRVIISIAADFIDYMHAIGFQINRNDILDIVIYGSNANYFYDKSSDIDVYILANLDDIQEKYKEIDFFTLYKSLLHTWRRQFKLQIHGLHIDLSLENVNKPKHGPGWWRSGPAYSIIHNKWIHKLVRLDEKTIREYRRLARQKAKEILNQAHKVIASNGRLDEFVHHQQKLRDDAMRNNCPQPLVPETMAYKMLRGSGLFRRLLMTSSQLRAIAQFKVD
jgi:hypothetical protein